MNQDLKITITTSGFAGSGKTTMCQLISKTLTGEGFNNFVIVGESENNEIAIEKSYKKKLATLVERNRDNKMLIRLETQQLVRGRR